MAGESTGSLSLIVKWSGNEYKVAINDNLTVSDLKIQIKNATGVLPERQKLMGLKFKGIYKMFHLQSNSPYH